MVRFQTVCKRCDCFALGAAARRPRRGGRRGPRRLWARAWGWRGGSAREINYSKVEGKDARCAAPRRLGALLVRARIAGRAQLHTSCCPRAQRHTGYSIT